MKTKFKNLSYDTIDNIIGYYKNHSIEDVCSAFNISSYCFDQICVKYNLSKRSGSDKSQLGIATKLNRYNFKANTNSDKVKQTKLDRYGDANYNNVEKYKETCLAKFGVDNFFKSEIFKNNYELYMINKYGSVENYHTQQVNKTQNTKLIRYNNPGYVNLEKRFQTNLIRYGSISPFGSEEIRQKAKSTLLANYGVTNPSFSLIIRKRISISVSSLEAQIKQRDTKIKNNSYAKSKAEDNYYEYLCTIYDKDDIIRQHIDFRYPFKCDFYIISEDLYIEFNGTWTHGCVPFDVNNEDCINTLNKWKSKAETSDYYKNAIYTWTDLDVRKLNCAKENNLNYKTIY